MQAAKAANHRAAPRRAAHRPPRAAAAALVVAFAALAALLARPVAAAQGYKVISGAAPVVSSAPPLSNPPWYTRDQGMSWVPLLYKAETKGDNLASYNCAAAERIGTCVNTAWADHKFPTLVTSDPFNSGDYNPYTAAAERQFTGTNDCVTWAECLSTQTLTVPAGQTLTVYYGVDVGYAQTSGGVAGYLELVMVENSKDPVPILQYYTRNVSVSALDVSNGFKLFPASNQPKSMVNALVTMQLEGGNYRWGFRNRGATGAAADNWVITRAFFGCVGPAHTTPSAVQVGYSDTSLVVDSGVSEQVADGSTVSNSSIEWRVECFGPHSGDAFIVTGGTLSLSVGGVGSDVIISNQDYQCSVTMTATTSNSCPLKHDLTIDVAASPVLAPTISGLPATGVLSGSYPMNLTLDTSSTTEVSGDPSYLWDLQCDGSPARTSSGASLTIAATGGGDVDVLTSYGNKNCGVKVTMSTAIQDAVTSDAATVVFKAPPVAQFKGAPYGANMAVPAVVALDATASKCANPPCSAKFIVVCPGRSPIILNSPVSTPVNLNAGPGQVLDPFVAPQIANNTKCTVMVTVTDGLGVTNDGSTTLAVIYMPPIVLPPGGIDIGGGIGGSDSNIGGPYPKLVNVTINATGILGDPTYNWSLKCPPEAAAPVAAADSQEPDWSFLVGPGGVIDPLNPYGNKVCLLSLSVSTPLQGTSTTSRTVVFKAPPVTPDVFGSTTYSVGPAYPDRATLDASATKCANVPCAFLWTVTCPDGTVVTKTGKLSSIRAGDGQEVDPDAMKEPTNCTLALSVKDVDGQTTEAKTVFQVLYIAPPIVMPPGSIGFLGGGVGADGSIGGPYPRYINVTVNAQGVVGTPTYNWTLKCPPDAPTLAATASGAAPKWAFLAGPGGVVNPLNPYANKYCLLGVSVSTKQQSAVSATKPLILRAPPIAPDLSEVVYTVGPEYPDSVTLDASTTQCANLPCVFKWSVDCPNTALLAKSGLVATYSAGVGQEIDPYDNKGAMNCTATFTAVDANKDNSTSTARIMTTSPPILLPPGSIELLGSGVTSDGSVAGPYPRYVNVSINATGVVGAPSYSWSLRCPPDGSVVTTPAVSASPKWSFLVGAGGVVDPLSPYGNKDCLLSITVSTALQGPTAASKLLSFKAPPVTPDFNAIRYEAGPNYLDSVALDAATAKCANAPCEYEWSVACPDGTKFSKSGQSANVSLALGSELDPYVFPSATKCSVGLQITDSGKPQQKAVGAASLNVLPGLFFPPGSISGLPGDESPVGGPYPKMVNMSVDGSVFIGETKYTWSIDCQGTDPIATNSSISWYAFWVGKGLDVDPFDPYGNKNCSIGIKVSTVPLAVTTQGLPDGAKVAKAGGSPIEQSESVSAIFLATPIPRLSVPSFEAGPIYPSVVQLDATPSQCASLPCAYEWTVTCPGMAPAKVSGAQASLQVGAGSPINPVQPPISSDLNCSVALVVSDSAATKQSGAISTFMMVYPAAPTPDIGGPYNVTAGQAVSLDASTTVCPLEPCTFEWKVACPGRDDVIKSGRSVNVTTGVQANATLPGSGNGTAAVNQTEGSSGIGGGGDAAEARDIDTWALNATLTCDVSLHVSDARNRSAQPSHATLNVAPAPPVCTVARKTSPSNIRAFSKGLSCATKKKLAMGRTVKADMSITVPPFKDPQGFDSFANITAIITNQGETACPCMGGACTCVADATVLQGGAMARVVPLLTSAVATGGRQYIFRYSATSVVTGLSCTGEAYLCVIRQKKNLRGAQPPQCLPFELSNTIRDATKCRARKEDPTTEFRAASMEEAWRMVGAA